MNDIKTSLYNQHKKLDAKIIPFAGYLMPVNYSKGIKSEYESVRNNVGMFDVSHMGFISIEGDKSSDFINFVTINNINKVSSGSAQYSVICNDNGGCVDDIIIYKKSDTSYYMIVNASNIYKDFDCIVIYSQVDTRIKRLQERGMNYEDIQNRIANQKDDDWWKNLGIVIQNDNLNDLHLNLDKIINQNS